MAPSKNTVSFADPLINDLSSLPLQPGNQSDNQPDDQLGYQPDSITQLLLWAVISDEETDSTLPKNHDFGATNLTAWNLIKDQLIMAEKYCGRATLAHNARLFEGLPDWSLGITKIPYLMSPTSLREIFYPCLMTSTGKTIHGGVPQCLG